MVDAIESVEPFGKLSAGSVRGCLTFHKKCRNFAIRGELVEASQSEDVTLIWR
jgi:hypothetical protein